jgi:hypothetical protein
MKKQASILYCMAKLHTSSTYKFRSMKRFILGHAIGVSLLFSVAVAHAQDSTTWYKYIAVNGLVSGSTTYNVNHPNTLKNQLRIFDVDANSILLDLVSLTVRHDATIGEAGFRLDVNAGPYIPRIMQSAGWPATNLDFEQAYLSYNAKIGSGLRFDLGKFLCPAGYEYVERFENYNENASHSFLFGYAIPYTHTGLRASYAFSDALSASAMVVNGWDNTVDNNKAKTGCLTATWTPSPAFNITGTAIVGPEKDTTVAELRSVYDIAGSLKLSERFMFGFNADYGREDDDVLKPEASDPSLTTFAPAVWKGAAAYLVTQITSELSACIRAEVFDDLDGVRTQQPQTIRELTITPSWKPNSHFVLRGDWRFDHSSALVFDHAGGFAQDQTTVSINALLLF